MRTLATAVFGLIVVGLAWYPALVLQDRQERTRAEWRAELDRAHAQLDRRIDELRADADERIDRLEWIARVELPRGHDDLSERVDDLDDRIHDLRTRLADDYSDLQRSIDDGIADAVGGRATPAGERQTNRAPASAQPQATPVQHGQWGTVARVVDGDTVDVSIAGKVEPVRLIGIDTPEVVDPRKPVQCFGREASARAHELLDGQTVRLEQDPSQDARDKYLRLLAYVWLPDGRMVNRELVAEGYAHEYTYDRPYKYQETFRNEEGSAKRLLLGFWAPATCAGDTQRAAAPEGPTSSAARPCSDGQVKGNVTSGIYHVPGGAFYAATKANVRCFASEASAAAAGFRRSKS